MKTAFKYFIAYFLLSLLGAIVMMFPVVIIQMALDPSAIKSSDFDLNPWAMNTAMIASQLVPLFYFWKKKWCDYRFFKDNNFMKLILWAAVGWLGYSLIEAFIQTYMPHFEWDFMMMDDISEMMQNPLGIISVCILAPLLEEGVFRGAIERKLLDTHRNPWFAIVVSAVFFAVAHMNLTQGVTALLIGMFMGWIYYRTRNIWLCIFVHALNNTVSTVGYLITNDETFPVNSFSLPVNLLLLVIGIVVVAYVVKRILKLTPVVPQPVLEQHDNVQLPPPLPTQLPE